MMKTIIVILLTLLGAELSIANAQFSSPVSWTFSQRPAAAKNEVVLQMEARLRPGWHVFSQHVKSGGPTPTLFAFQPDPNVQLLGAVTEPKSITYFEPLFKMDLSYFENEVRFEQRVKKVKQSKSPQIVKGKVEFMVCSAKECLPPDEVEFEIPLVEKAR